MKTMKMVNTFFPYLKCVPKLLILNANTQENGRWIILGIWSSDDSEKKIREKSWEEKNVWRKRCEIQAHKLSWDTFGKVCIIEKH